MIFQVRKKLRKVSFLGVYKQWTGLLEWWNSGMVDWIVFVLIFIVCHIITIYPVVFPLNFLNSYTYTVVIHNVKSHEP